MCRAVAQPGRHLQPNGIHRADSVAEGPGASAAAPSIDEQRGALQITVKLSRCGVVSFVIGTRVPIAERPQIRSRRTAMSLASALRQGRPWQCRPRAATAGG